MNNVLIITATIQPPADAVVLTRIDPTLRRQDYVTAFEFYLSMLGTAYDRIIFADNSDQNVDDLIAMSKADPRVSVISFDGMNNPGDYGRAYGEMKLIGSVYERFPELLSHPGRVWKVTGRYILRNIDKVMQSGRATDELIVNCRDYPQIWADLHCFGWTASGWTNFVSTVGDRLREDIIRLSPEILFRVIIDNLIMDNYLTATRRFKSTPIIEGVRGFNNQPYLEDARGRRKLMLRQFARRFTPWIWI